MQNAILSNNTPIPYLGLGVFEMGNEQEAYEAIRYALDLGYRHIDTAMIYHNEEIVGKAIKDSQIAREEIFVTTKVWTNDIRSMETNKAFELSLKKLQLDYIDLYLIHWPIKDYYVSTWHDMESIYDSGRARAIGVSNYQIHHLTELLAVCTVVPMVNQFETHPYLNQNELINYCHSKNIQPEAYSPLCAQQNDLLQQPILLELAEKYAKTTAQIVLRWNIERGVVVIPKSANKQRQAENLAIFDFSLSPADIAQINSLNNNERVRFNPDDYPF